MTGRSSQPDSYALLFIGHGRGTAMVNFASASITTSVTLCML